MVVVVCVLPTATGHGRSPAAASAAAATHLQRATAQGEQRTPREHSQHDAQSRPVIILSHPTHAAAACGADARGGEGDDAELLDPQALQGGPSGDPNLLQQHAALAASLGLPPAAVLHALQQHPLASGLTTAQLSSTAIGLSSALLLSPAQALAMVLKRPVLVRERPADVRAAVEAIARLAAMDAQDAAPLVAAQPALLDVPVETLRADLLRLSSTLEVPSSGVLLILSRCSRASLRQLLEGPQALLRQQLQDLREVLEGRFGARGGAPLCQVLVTRWPDLLVGTPAAQVDASLSMLVRLLRLPKRQMMTLLTRCAPACSRVS